MIIDPLIKCLSSIVYKGKVEHIVYKGKVEHMRLNSII